MMKAGHHLVEMTEADLVWIDCEFTGLNPEVDRIIEIATLITDSELNIIAEGPSLAIHQSEEQLALMDDWNVTHHTDNGLIERVRASEITEEEAERQTLEFVKQHCDERKSPLCGNTIGQDRRFLRRYMPDLHRYLHYRSIDVSSVKEIAKRWYPEVPKLEKSGGHRAMDDIRESVAELAHYREHVFR